MTGTGSTDIKWLAEQLFDGLITSSEYAARLAELTAGCPAQDSVTRTVTVPARFYDDHVMRDGLGGTVTRRTSQRVTVELTQQAANDLLSDARFYAVMGEREFDRSEQGIVKSARATVKAMANG